MRLTSNTFLCFELILKLNNILSQSKHFLEYRIHILDCQRVFARQIAFPNYQTSSEFVGFVYFILLAQPMCFMIRYDVTIATVVETFITEVHEQACPKGDMVFSFLLGYH